MSNVAFIVAIMSNFYSLAYLRKAAPNLFFCFYSDILFLGESFFILIGEYIHSITVMISMFLIHGVMYDFFKLFLSNGEIGERRPS